MKRFFETLSRYAGRLQLLVFALMLATVFRIINFTLVIRITLSNTLQTR